MTEGKLSGEELELLRQNSIDDLESGIDLAMINGEIFLHWILDNEIRYRYVRDYIASGDQYILLKVLSEDYDLVYLRFSDVFRDATPEEAGHAR